SSVCNRPAAPIARRAFTRHPEYCQGFLERQKCHLTALDAGWRWQDVDLKRAIITIPCSKHGEARRIQINSTARAALLALRERGDGVGYVCPGYDGPRTRDWRNWLEKAVQAAGIQNLHWHDLRHTFASRLVMAGVPLRAVQVLMGHKRIETTLRYSHLGEAHLYEAVERLTENPTATRTATSTKGPIVGHMPATA
ncbi:MAG TPA: site-specific integrase, partial [Candidatus Acidoferrales bacterium]|nr:site-specific integrase [Candidatus Acidoferrales bacterium]